LAQKEIDQETERDASKKNLVTCSCRFPSIFVSNNNTDSSEKINANKVIRLDKQLINAAKPART
jgi:hypothetical protein